MLDQYEYTLDNGTKVNGSMVNVIAMRCHEVNRMYCRSIGDNSQPIWEHAPDNIKFSAISGVLFQLNNPNSLPSDSHENWLKLKEADGWTYGEVKDMEKKTHPCFVPYDQLPEDQKMKDELFQSTVRSNLYLLD